jgi:predicted TIM-barrel fold metal-dependent hydrolase
MKNEDPSFEPSRSAAVKQRADVPTSGLYAPPREDWLARHVEEVIEPDLAIVDAHHHLWDRAEGRYLFGDFLDDLGSGHRIVATVYVDCRSMYRTAGPESLRPVGEVEFVNGVAAMSASGQYGQVRVAAGIVGHADLRLGEAAGAVLDALERAGGGRFRGVRHVSAWDADPMVMRPMASRPRGLLAEPAFRAGFACLAPRGLSFDAFLFHPQLTELLDLARAFPDTPIVLDHAGGPIGLGHYAGQRDAVFADWKRGILGLAACPNVQVKLGGLGMRLPGLDFHERAVPPGSAELAAAWRPFIETCIEAFGPARSMFESNFPPDKGSCSYGVIWNAFKRLAQGYSVAERTDLFSGTASRFYRLEI